MNQSFADRVDGSVEGTSQTDLQWPPNDDNRDADVLWIEEDASSFQPPQDPPGWLARNEAGADALERFAEESQLPEEPRVAQEPPFAEEARFAEESRFAAESGFGEEFRSAEESATAEPSVVPTAPQVYAPAPRTRSLSRPDRHWARLVAWGTAATLCGAIAGTFTRQVVDPTTDQLSISAPAAPAVQLPAPEAVQFPTPESMAMAVEQQPVDKAEATPPAIDDSTTLPSNLIVRGDVTSQDPVTGLKPSTMPESRPTAAAPNAGKPEPERPEPTEQMRASAVEIPAVPIERTPLPALPPPPTVAAAPPPAAAAAAPIVPEPPRPVPAEVQDNERIQTVLRRYQNAYDDLDAAGAKAIWPTVDERALSRAFDGLRSQDLVFDRCDLSVAGASARAVCDGRATYVRKIGNKDPHTEPRQWVFELQKRDSGWTIAKAETR